MECPYSYLHYQPDFFIFHVKKMSVWSVWGSAQLSWAMTLSLPHLIIYFPLPSFPVCLPFSPSCLALIPSHRAKARNENKWRVTAEPVVPFVCQRGSYREQMLAEQGRLETLLAWVMLLGRSPPSYFHLMMLFFLHSNILGVFILTSFRLF